MVQFPTWMKAVFSLGFSGQSEKGNGDDAGQYCACPGQGSMKPFSSIDSTRRLGRKTIERFT